MSYTKAGYRAQLIVGDPGKHQHRALSGAQVSLPADADGHAPRPERIRTSASVR